MSIILQIPVICLCDYLKYLVCWASFPGDVHVQVIICHDFSALEIFGEHVITKHDLAQYSPCLLYTSDAADE